MPTPGSVTVTAASISFDSSTASAQTVGLAQANNLGGFSVSSCTSGGSTLATGSIAGQTLTVTPVSNAAGTCSVTITGSGGKSATISVTVLIPIPTTITIPNKGA